MYIRVHMLDYYNSTNVSLVEIEEKKLNKELLRRVI